MQTVVRTKKSPKKPASFVALLFLLLFAVMVASCQFPPQARRFKKDEPKRLLLSIDRLMQQGHYVKAHHYLEVLNEKWAATPLADDVAYRLAYLHVLADSANPYFNYRAASRAFEQCLKKFPHSAYRSACNNWLKILYFTFDLQKRFQLQQSEQRALQKKVRVLQRKIETLQRTLKDLEQVIKRNE